MLSKFLRQIIHKNKSMLYSNRKQAANILAERLLNIPEIARAEKDKLIILGIPRGGVVLADIVARKLSTDCDIVVGRKLGAPENKELGIGAVMEDGTMYLNRDLVTMLRVSSEYLEREKIKEMNEIKRRLETYRKTVPYNIRDKIAVIVDDGIATGATIIAACRWLRKQGVKYLIIAVPVCPLDTADILKNEADIILVLATPAYFNSVGQFYQNFDPVSDEQVIQIMHYWKRL
jgi:putative phosphoribosyl transferase